MTKVGIITIHRHLNVGCPLQAYGLQEAITRLGFNCEIIDYYFPNAFHRKPTIKAKIKKVMSRQLKRVLCGRDFDISEKRFNDFFQNQFNLSARSYKSVQELQDNPPDYDLYCVGSDQVWHPQGTYMDPIFYCGFAPKGKPVVSYASSFGVTKIPGNYEELYKKYFSRFEMFGVRELSGVELIRKLTGKEAQLVVDPTLLLKAEDWLKKVSPHNVNEPYILCYGSPYPNTYVEQMALHIQKQTGLKIFHLFGLPWQVFDKRIKHIFDIGPLVFLSWINNATLVITTSFHGTIFSTNFKRPFYSVYANEEMGSRQLNILKCLQLEDRGIKVGSEFPTNGFFEIDFGNAHSKLDEMRADSYDYLKRMLAICQ